MTVWGGADYRGYRGRRKRLPRGVAWFTLLRDVLRGLLRGVAGQAGGET
jgi:hypothetical protein